jgi:hypothetical protein
MNQFLSNYWHRKRFIHHKVYNNTNMIVPFHNTHETNFYALISSLFSQLTGRKRVHEICSVVLFFRSHFLQQTRWPMNAQILEILCEIWIFYDGNYEDTIFLYVTLCSLVDRIADDSNEAADRKESLWPSSRWQQFFWNIGMCLPIYMVSYLSNIYKYFRL